MAALPWTEWQLSCGLGGRLRWNTHGKWLIGAYSDPSGREKLIQMSIENLRQGRRDYTVIFDFENSSPANFIFSPDGRFIFGSSYYSGVSNIYRYDVEREDMSIISNCETGCFRPMPISEDMVLVMRYTNQGFAPVIIDNQALENVNAIKFLGNELIANHPVLKTWKAPPPSAVDLDAQITHTGAYNVLKHLSLASAYPILERYKDSASVGLRLNFADPSLFSQLKLSGSYSLDDNLPLDERFHLRIGFRYWSWRVNGWWNRADFYDFFGPIQMNRKGYGLAVAYEKALQFEKTGSYIKALTYSIEVAGYAGLDTSPTFQEIASTFSEALSLTGTLISHHLITPLGALQPMQGVTWELISINTYVKTGAPTRLVGNLDVGIPLPLRHSSLWLRSSVGYAFGERDNSFTNFYFGGFRNNYVDYSEREDPLANRNSEIDAKDYQRYRLFYAFPGVDINSINGVNYAKLMVDWTLPPLRFRRLGWLDFYCRWGRLALFTSGLMTNLDRVSERREISNVGAQLDFNFVFFSSLNSYLSVGYAMAFEKDRSAQKEFMISLKLL